MACTTKCSECKRARKVFFLLLPVFFSSSILHVWRFHIWKPTFMLTWCLHNERELVGWLIGCCYSYRSSQACIHTHTYMKCVYYIFRWLSAIEWRLFDTKTTETENYDFLLEIVLSIWQWWTPWSSWRCVCVWELVYVYVCEWVIVHFIWRTQFSEHMLLPISCGKVSQLE